MARQRLGEKKVAALRLQLGIEIVAVLVRGGTDHRLDLCLEDGRVIYYWPRTGEQQEAEDLTHPFKRSTVPCD